MGPYRGRGRGRGRPRGAKQKSAPETKPERAAQSYRPMGAALTVEEVRSRPCPLHDFAAPPCSVLQIEQLVFAAACHCQHANA